MPGRFLRRQEGRRPRLRNVAIYAIQKVSQLGGIVIACSDTKGWIEDQNGIDYRILEDIYNAKRSATTRA